MTLLRTGTALFVVGALSTVGTIGLWLITGSALPTWAYLVAMLMPVGLVLIGVDFLRKARQKIG